MTDPRRAALLLGLGAVILLAAGCAQPPPPFVPAGAAAPVAELANDGQEPLPLLAAGCDELLRLGGLQASFSAPIELVTDEDSTPKGFPLLAFRQAGGLKCIWGGAAFTDEAPDAGLQLWISPDAAEVFAAYVANPQQTGGVLVADTLGDASLLDCGTEAATGLHCRADVLLGSWWVTAIAGDADADAYPAEVEKMSSIVRDVLDGIEASGEPRTAWAPPADSYDGEALCSEPAVAALALGVEADGVLTEPYASGSAFGPVLNRAAGARCEWHGGGGTVRITTLQGGAWAFDRLAADGIGAGAPAPAPATAVPTALDGALVSCGDGCNVVFLTGGSMVAVDNLVGDLASVTATAQAIAEVISAGA